MVSTVAVYNAILRRRLDLAAELLKPWYIDRREEIPPGKKPWFEMPVFCFAEEYFSTNWHNYYVETAQRFDELPRFTESQIEALDMLDQITEELRCDMIFEPGTFSFCAITWRPTDGRSIRIGPSPSANGICCAYGWQSPVAGRWSTKFWNAMSTSSPASARPASS